MPPKIVIFPISAHVYERLGHPVIILTDLQCTIVCVPTLESNLLCFSRAEELLGGERDPAHPLYPLHSRRDGVPRSARRQRQSRDEGR